MHTIARSTDDSPASLPAAPDVAPLLAAASARLHALERTILPRLRDNREFLMRVWHSEDADALPLYLPPVVMAACHPAGFDRLAMAIADEEAMTREAVALRELKQALEDYDAGGRLIRVELAGDPQEVMATAVAAQQPVAQDCSPTSEREHRRRLREYARLLEREIHVATISADQRQLASLQAESRMLRAHLESSTTQINTATRVAPRRADGRTAAVRRKRVA